MAWTLFALYLPVTGVALWLILFPDRRDALLHRLGRMLRAMGRAGRTNTSRFKQGMHSSGRATGTHTAGLWRWAGRRRWVLLTLFLVLTFPALLVLHWQGAFDLRQFVPGHEPPNPVVARLLRGEHLVPPQPLPPEVFTTREVERVRPDLQYANRKWQRLKPEFRQRLLAVYQVMREQYGYRMVLIEGYRSPRRQQRLANNGSHVTQAGAYQSYHQFGLAADSAFMRDGQIRIERSSAWIKQGYDLYGKVARRYGLTWGGDWSFRDYGHVELRGSRYRDPTSHNNRAVPTND